MIILGAILLFAGWLAGWFGALNTGDIILLVAGLVLLLIGVVGLISRRRWY